MIYCLLLPTSTDPLIRTCDHVPSHIFPRQVSESEKKAADYARSASQSAQAFASECKALGIEGSAIRPGLRALCSELPMLFEGALEKVKAEGVGEACRWELW